ncbi:TlpA family protein disulfide reductase [Blastococcus sp. SYSU D00695]
MRRALAAVTLAAAVLTGCTSGGDSAPEPSAFEDTVLGACADQPDRPAAGDETMPDLRLDCPGGGTLDLGRAPGAPTVVNLWASWCTPCREELPLVQGLADRAGTALNVVGVISRDGAPQAESFAEDAGATFPSAFDGDGELMAQLGASALPYTYFLDADGGIAFVKVGPVDSVDEFAALVAEHLGVRV